MKQYLLVLVSRLTMLGIVLNTVFGQSPLFWGNVKWASGYPATAVEVRLVRNDETVSTVYTDQAGSYAFFGIKGRPSDYDVMVYNRESLLGQIRVPEMPAGRQIPDIKLTGQTLRAKVVAVPGTVGVGQKTLITVTVLDRNGIPVPNVRITISAGGGKFLDPKEPYNPRSRLQGPYRAQGLTSTKGMYATSWVCNPCAGGYVLNIEGNKDYYIPSAFDLTVHIR